MKFIVNSIAILLFSFSVNVGVTSSNAVADEQVELFLQKLLDRGYYNTAVDYLNYLENQFTLSAGLQKADSARKSSHPD